MGQSRAPRRERRRRRAVRPARDRRRDRRRRDRRACDARAGLASRSSTRRLRRRDLERLLEAHSRRASLPSAGRRAARPRGPPGTAHADAGRRAPPRPPPAVPAPALRERPLPAVRSSRAGSCSTPTLARSRLNWLVPPARSRELVPGLRLDGLRSCALYADAATHDGRLCLANVRAAADGGRRRSQLRRGRPRSAPPAGGSRAPRWPSTGRRWRCARARSSNATGPWIDHVRRLEDPGAGPSIRLSKGVHALLPLEGEWAAALTIPHDAVRVTFADPVGGDADARDDGHAVRGRSRRVAATEEDIEQILARGVRRTRPVAARAGPRSRRLRRAARPAGRRRRHARARAARRSSPAARPGC